MKVKHFIVIYLSIWIFQILIGLIDTDYLLNTFNSPSKLTYATLALNILGYIKLLMLFLIGYKIFTYPNRSSFLNW